MKGPGPGVAADFVLQDFFLEALAAARAWAPTSRHVH